MNISHLSKAQVLAALYNGSKPLGMGILHFNPKPMTEVEAEEILKVQKDFDYLFGRVMKINLSTDELRTDLYNRDIGEGAAEFILSRLSPKKNAETPPSAVIKKETPGSNTVKSLEYNRDTKTLTIAFNSGTYDYLAVPQEVAEKAFAAESIGKFVHSDLKGKFDTFKKVEK